MSERILIVDDAPESIQLFVALLRKSMPELHLETATSGAAAIADAKKGNFDLILLDAMMPGITGFDVCRELKNDPITRNVPVLMISGVMTGSEHRLSGLQCGAEGYVCKPFERDELVAQVNTLLRMKRYEDRLRRQEELLERELAERTAHLRASEEQLRSLYEHSPDAIFVEDREGTVLDVNAAACRLHGLDRAHLVGRKVVDLVPAVQREQVAADFLRWWGTGLQTYEGSSLGADGNPIPVEIRTNHIRYRGNQALLLHVRDISSRRKTEEELRQHREHLEDLVRERARELHQSNSALTESRRSFHSIVEKSGEGILVVDAPGNVQYANPAAGGLLGRTITDLIGGPCGFPLDPRHPVELQNPSAPGVAIEAVVDASEWQGRPAYVVFLRDITARKQMEQQLRRTENLESVGVLAGGIAHDFNNLLAGVLGNISFAKSESASRETILDVLGEAERAALRAKSLTQQLLTFAKGGVPVRKPGSIAELLEDTARFVLAGSKAAHRLRVPPELWNAYMDGGQMSQVIENIVLNADQAMPRGGHIDIVAENVVCAADQELPAVGLKPGRYVRVSIRDQGIGMTPEVMTRIFDPYFTTKQEGSGLGLAVAYSIMSKHEGAITVSSQPGEGTTFCLYVPATDAELRRDPPGESDAIRRGGGHILVMDDEPFIRTLVVRMLVALGYTAEAVADGQAAIARYREAMESGKRFDAVLLDLTIPGGMGGKDTMEALRVLDPKALGIVSSGYALEPVFSAFAEHGFRGGIAKPYDMKALAAVIADVLQER